MAVALVTDILRGYTTATIGFVVTSAKVDVARCGSVGRTKTDKGCGTLAHYSSLRIFLVSRVNSMEDWDWI